MRLTSYALRTWADVHQIPDLTLADADHTGRGRLASGRYPCFHSNSKCSRARRHAERERSPGCFWAGTQSKDAEAGMDRPHPSTTQPKTGCSAHAKRASPDLELLVFSWLHSSAR